MNLGFFDLYALQNKNRHSPTLRHAESIPCDEDAVRVDNGFLYS